MIGKRDVCRDLDLTHFCMNALQNVIGRFKILHYDKLKNLQLNPCQNILITLKWRHLTVNLWTNISAYLLPSEYIPSFNFVLTPLTSSNCSDLQIITIILCFKTTNHFNKIPKYLIFIHFRIVLKVEVYPFCWSYKINFK